MLRLEILQTKKLNRSIGEARVAWRSVTEGTTSNKPCRRQFAHIVQRCGIAVHEFTVNVFGKISAANARLRDVFKRRLRTAAYSHGVYLQETMMAKYSAVQIRSRAGMTTGGRGTQNGGQTLKNCPNKTAPFLVSETNRGFLRADSNATCFGTRCHVRTRSDALRGECEPCDRRISPMCESLTKTGALMFVPAYLSLLLAMAVPFAPGDALRFLLLSLCFMFLGAGVAFLVASDIVRGR